MSELRADLLAEAVLKNNHIELDVVVHAVLDSTNSWCLRQHKLGKQMPFVCLAENQTSGKGRRGKIWRSVANSNIAVSVAWPFVLSEQPLHLLSLSIAIVIVQALENLGLSKVQIKWPNDVYVNGEKIAGILIETQPIKNKIASETNTKKAVVAAVMGVGLNYDMSAFNKGDERLMLTDIREQCAKQKITPLPSRQKVATSLLIDIVSMCNDYKQFIENNFELFSDRYDYCKGKRVDVVLDNKIRVSGTAQGINENAELLVLIENELRVFNSAEVSVKAMSEGK